MGPAADSGKMIRFGHSPALWPSAECCKQLFWELDGNPALPFASSEILGTLPNCLTSLLL